MLTFLLLIASQRAVAVPVAASPDGHTIALGGRSITLWNVDGTLLDALPESRTGRRVGFAGNGMLYATSQKGVVEVWPDGLEAPPLAFGDNAPYAVPAPAGDRVLLLRGREDDEVWSLASRERVRALGQINSPAWSADGSVLAVFVDGKIQILGGADLQLQATVAWVRDDIVVADGAPPPAPRRLVLAAATRHVVASNNAGKVRVYGLDGTQLAAWRVPGARVAVAPDGTEALTMTLSGRIERWELPSGERRGAIVHDLRGDLKVAWAPDSSAFLLVSKHEVRAFARGGSPGIAVHLPNERIHGVTWVGGGRFLVDIYALPPLLVDAETGSRRWLSGPGQSLDLVGFSPDGLELAWIRDGTLVRWSLRRGRSLRVADGVDRAAWAGEHLVSMGYDGRLVGPAPYEGPGRLHDLIVSEEGRDVVAWGPEVARVHDVARGSLRLAVEGEGLADARLSPRGDVLAVRDPQGARVWTVAEGGPGRRLDRVNANRLWVPDASRVWLGGQEFPSKGLWEHDLDNGDVRLRLREPLWPIVDGTRDAWVIRGSNAVGLRSRRALGLRSHFRREEGETRVRGIAYPDDLDWVATVHTDGVWFWDPVTEEVEKTVALPWVGHDAVASPNGQWCVVASPGGHLWWIDVRAGEVVSQWSANPGGDWDHDLRDEAKRLRKGTR